MSRPRIWRAARSSTSGSEKSDRLRPWQAGLHPIIIAPDLALHARFLLQRGRRPHMTPPPEVKMAAGASVAQVLAKTATCFRWHPVRVRRRVQTGRGMKGSALSTLAESVTLLGLGTLYVATARKVTDLWE